MQRVTVQLAGGHIVTLDYPKETYTDDGANSFLDIIDDALTSAGCASVRLDRDGNGKVIFNAEFIMSASIEEYDEQVGG